jgi:hypothetical protein
VGAVVGGAAAESGVHPNPHRPKEKADTEDLQRIIMPPCAGIGAPLGEQFVHSVNCDDGNENRRRSRAPAGHAANHDRPSSSENESLATMAITQHLLEAMYESQGWQHRVRNGAGERVGHLTRSNPCLGVLG